METIFRLKEIIVKILTFNYWVVKKVILKEFPDPKKIDVLDLGCGSGTLSRLFNKRLYFGVDLDRRLVRFAQKKNKGYQYQVADATNFAIKKKFDLVLVVGVFHHLNFRESLKMVQVIKEHLKKEGTAIVIEAISPICKINLPGLILRKIDEGKYIRKLADYQGAVAGVLKIKKAYSQIGGLVDYGVIVVQNK